MLPKAALDGRGAALEVIVLTATAAEPDTAPVPAAAVTNAVAETVVCALVTVGLEPTVAISKPADSQ